MLAQSRSALGCCIPKPGENSGDTAALQRDGTTLRNDSIAAIAHPNPPIDPADWGNAMTASMLGAGLGAVMGKLTTTGLGSAFQD